MNLTMNDLASHGFASDRRKIGSSLADVDPMNVDKTVGDRGIKRLNIFFWQKFPQ